MGALLLTTPPPPRRVLARDAQLRAEPLPAELAALASIAQPKLPSGEGDWLTGHPEEGQSIEEHRVDCEGSVTN